MRTLLDSKLLQPVPSTAAAKVLQPRNSQKVLQQPQGRSGVLALLKVLQVTSADLHSQHLLPVLQEKLVPSERQAPALPFSQAQPGGFREVLQ